MSILNNSIVAVLLVVVVCMCIIDVTQATLGHRRKTGTKGADPTAVRNNNNNNKSKAKAPLSQQVDDGVYTIEGRIKGMWRRSSRTRQPMSQTRIVMNDGAFVTIPRVDGSFSINGVPSGTHTLEVFCVDYVFDPVRIDVSVRSKTIKASTERGRRKLPYPLVLRPSSEAVYFRVHEPYDWSSMLKNPMVIMMGFTALMVVVMPKMLNSMDPKELEEMKKMKLTDMLKPQART